MNVQNQLYEKYGSNTKSYLSSLSKQTLIVFIPQKKYS